MSVSPLSVGLISSRECWLLAYNVWLGVLTYSLFDFPHVEVVPTLWGTPSHPLSQWCVPCGFCTCWHVSLSPKPEYLEIMQMLSLLKHLGVPLSFQEVSY